MLGKGNGCLEIEMGVTYSISARVFSTSKSIGLLLKIVPMALL